MEWTDPLGARYHVDRVLRIQCACGQSATATLLTVTWPPPEPRVTKWFRPPAHWFVALTGDLTRYEDGKITHRDPFVRCPTCIRLAPVEGDRATKGPLATAAEHRPENFEKLPVPERWAIDKALGILDWSGKPDE